MFSDIKSLFLPENTESESDAAASESGLRLAMENHTRVEKAVRHCNEEELARSFQLAFNQGNLTMMAMLTDVGRYKPSPEMKNDKGVSLKQWLSDQAKGADEATRNLMQAVERKMDTPSLALSSRAMAQVAALDMGWMGGMSFPQGNSLILPAPQRSANLALAA